MRRTLILVLITVVNVIAAVRNVYIIRDAQRIEQNIHWIEHHPWRYFYPIRDLPRRGISI